MRAKYNEFKSCLDREFEKNRKKCEKCEVDDNEDEKHVRQALLKNLNSES